MLGIITRMWEEEPWYQKQQMKTIGVLIVVFFAVYVLYAVSERDWHLLRQTLLFGAALLIAMGTLSGTAWLLVKIFTRGQTKDSQERRDPDA
jgi:hypothetical protein